MAERNLMLCFESTDPTAIDLASRYWSRNVLQKWTETVEVIAQSAGIKKTQIAAEVRTAARACDLELRCFWCKFPEQIESRAAYIDRYAGSRFRRYAHGDKKVGLCSVCEVKHEKACALAKDEELAVKRARIKEAVAQQQSARPAIFLHDLCNVDAILLLAFLQASREIKSAKDGDFIYERSWRITACPSVDQGVYSRLYEIGAIVPSADSTLDEFDFDESGGLCFDFHRIRWTLGLGLRDIQLTSLRQQLAGFLVRVGDDPQGLFKLWDSVAVAECLSCLHERAAFYYFGDEGFGEKATSAVKYALEKFSIPQVWSIIHSSSKYAASLLRSRQIGARQARNMMPSLITGSVDRAIAREWTTPAAPREWDSESQLTKIFFGIVCAKQPNGFRICTSTTIRNLAPSSETGAAI